MPCLTWRSSRSVPRTDADQHDDCAGRPRRHRAYLPAAKLQFGVDPAAAGDKLSAALGVPSASVDEALCWILEKLERKGGGPVEQK